MRRADRLFAIIQALRGGRLRTAQALAEQLEVSARTIYRDLADLQAQGVPIDGERGIGYILRNGYFLPPLALSPLEMEALRWGVAFVASQGDEALAEAAGELRVKIEAGVADDGATATFASRGRPPSSIQRAMMAVIRTAIASRRRLAIAYRDADTAPSLRTVRPLELSYWGSVWTLTTWCELRDDFRTFRLDRIETCEPGAPFRHEPGRRMSDFLAQMTRCHMSS
jgi:predicted DNA-binding transcriptional regulator YafY